MNEFVKKNGINFGLILGVLGILSGALFYTLDVTLFANIWVGITLGIITIVIGIIAVAKVKKAQEGFITFKDALATFLLAMLIGSLINTIFIIILFNVVDPAAKNIVTEEIINMTVRWMKQAGSKASEIKQKVEEIRAADSFSPLVMLTSYFKGLIFHIVIGLIVAAAMKRNKESYNQ